MYDWLCHLATSFVLSSYKGGHACDKDNHSCENVMLTIVHIIFQSKDLLGLTDIRDLVTYDYTTHSVSDWSCIFYSQAVFV